MTPTPKVKMRKAEGRYYVEVDEVRVGWVLRTMEGWEFYATIREPLIGERIGDGRTRDEALWNGLCNLRIWHGGCVYRLDFETMKDERVYVDEPVLASAADLILNRMYPEARA